MRAAVLRTLPSAVYERRLLDVPPMPRWSGLGGRAVLLGDAAHAMHPGPGLGAQCAFEDADTLARCLVGAVRGAGAAAMPLPAMVVPEAVER